MDRRHEHGWSRFNSPERRYLEDRTHVRPGARSSKPPRAGSQPNPSADATGIAVEPESKSIPNPCMSWSPDSWPIAMQDWHLGTLVPANFSVGWLSLTSQ